MITTLHTHIERQTGGMPQYEIKYQRLHKRVNDKERPEDGYGPFPLAQ